MLSHSSGRSPLEGLTRNEEAGSSSQCGVPAPSCGVVLPFRAQMLNALVQRAPRPGDILGGLPVDAVSDLWWG